MKTYLQLTQERIDKAHREFVNVYVRYHNGMITAHEFRDMVNKVMLPDSIPGVVDPNTGLKHK